MARARAWLDEDPDPETRAELAGLIEAGATAELADRFAGTLQFGTAGLRGELGAGPMRMNRAVVIRAAAGLAAYLTKRHPTAPAATTAAGGTGTAGLVVIGHDARHKSADFARDTAAVMTGAGLRAALLPGPLPTPVLAFAVRHLGAVAGVEVTASHNPPRDNGYKVYLGDGSQIVPPADADIAAEIAAVRALADVPRPDSGWEVLGEEIVTAYLARATSVLADGSPRTARIVHTALHGVGTDTVLAAFERAGFPAPLPVAEQAEPDPDFPTVAFPNPEEPGAMDLAFATARAATQRATDPDATGTAPDLIIANDPDADRCAVAVPDPSTAAGWRMLRGDEVGVLLGAHLVRRGVADRAADTTGEPDTRPAFAASIVSSSLLGRVAEAAGLRYEETLTGFKWISRVPGLRYGYEEALGYCVDPEGVRDKDGITAALLVAELASELKQQGRTLGDLLDDLAVEHGLHATDQLSVRVDDLTVIRDAMRRLRAHPPTALAGLPVTTAEDLAAGTSTLPPTDGLRYTLDGAYRARVVVRPSGTEPKLKCYLEIVVPVPDRADLPAAHRTASDHLAALKADLSEAAGPADGDGDGHRRLTTRAPGARAGAPAPLRTPGGPARRRGGSARRRVLGWRGRRVSSHAEQDRQHHQTREGRGDDLVAPADLRLALGGGLVRPRLGEFPQVVHAAVGRSPGGFGPVGASVDGGAAEGPRHASPDSAEQPSAAPRSGRDPRLLAGGPLAGPQGDGDRPQLVLGPRPVDDLVGVAGAELGDRAPGQRDRTEGVAHPQPLLVREHRGPDRERQHQRDEEQQHGERQPGGAPLPAHQGVATEPGRHREQQHAPGEPGGRAVHPVRTRGVLRAGSRVTRSVLVVEVGLGGVGGTRRVVPHRAPAWVVGSRHTAILPDAGHAPESRPHHTPVTPGAPTAAAVRPPVFRRPGHRPRTARHPPPRSPVQPLRA